MNAEVRAPNTTVISGWAAPARRSGVSGARGLERTELTCNDGGENSDGIEEELKLGSKAEEVPLNCSEGEQRRESERKVGNELT